MSLMWNIHLNLQYFANFPALSWLSCCSGTFYGLNSDSPVTGRGSGVSGMSTSLGISWSCSRGDAWGFFFSDQLRIYSTHKSLGHVGYSSETLRRYWRRPLDMTDITHQWPTKSAQSSFSEDKVRIETRCCNWFYYWRATARAADPSPGGWGVFWQTLRRMRGPETEKRIYGGPMETRRKQKNM